VSTVIPFSQALRERTWSSDGGSEGATFMSDLMTGKGTRDDYIALVAQHYFIYAALESAAGRMADNPVAALFISPQLTRLPALERDLQFLLGDGWRDRGHAAAHDPALRRTHRHRRGGVGRRLHRPPLHALSRRPLGRRGHPEPHAAAVRF
jgi:hypothetical protein